ncbi:MAG TPA: 4-hydroxybenzoate 3-monooxygenase [Candidatus Binatia bacterium]|nr:4-hydroxybenzoate 3-monooxygenase [Candidatus Binatia bacterium]
MRVRVGIVGAGPAGLLLSHLLHLAGIESVVLERQSREYCEDRVRAGVIEQGARDVLIESGLGERLKREGLFHGGVALRFAGQSRRIDFVALTGGKGVTVYGQQEVVKDMIAARLAAGGHVEFDVPDVSVHGIETTQPKVRYTDNAGHAQELVCDFVAGCDGYHGICRPSIPPEVLTAYERQYHFGWLGILAQARPVSDELIYVNHPRGFALLSMRSMSIGRIYLQCKPDEDPEEWSDDRFWDELDRRLEGVDVVKPERGRSLRPKDVTQMRSWVSEPMQYGRLFLAGDATHIVPPTGAKGMNLAIADVSVLSRAIAAFYENGSTELLDRYSEICLRRVWKAERFSWWMTTMLHQFDDKSPFEQRLQLAELDYVTSSRAGSESLAENYVGLPFE